MDDHCAQCGFDGRALTADEVTAGLRALPAEVQRLLDGTPLESLRRKPDATTWSALEYVGHLRDLMAFHRFLIERAVQEDVPEVPAVDPDESVAGAGYNDADSADLMGQFSRRVERLATLLDGLDASALDRQARFLDGSLDVRLVMHSALHEGFHHRLDIVDVLARVQPAG